MEKKIFNILRIVELPTLVDIKEVPISNTSIDELYKCYINTDTIFEEVEIVGAVFVEYDVFKNIKANPNIRSNIYDLCEEKIINYNNEYNYSQDTPQYIAIGIEDKKFLCFNLIPKEAQFFLAYIKDGELKKIAFARPLKPNFFGLYIDF